MDTNKYYSQSVMSEVGDFLVRSWLDTESIYIESLDLLIFTDGRAFHVEQDWPTQPMPVIKFVREEIQPVDYMKEYFRNQWIKGNVLKHLNGLISEKTAEIKDMMDKAGSLNKYLDWWQHDNLMTKLELARKQLAKYQSQKKIIQTSKGDQQLPIAQAKSVPITEIVPVNRAGFASCPFHKDRTPSFKYYPKENRFKCFSCNEGGDVIDLIRKMYNLSLPEAVKRLTGK